MLHKPIVKWTLILLGIPVILLALLWGGLEYASYRNEQELETVMGTIDVPEEWELTKESHAGDISCWSMCQYYIKTYAVPDDIDAKDAEKLAEIIETVNLKINNTKKACRKGDRFNDSYCVAEAETSDYRVSGSTSKGKKEKSLVSIGVFKR